MGVGVPRFVDDFETVVKFVSFKLSVQPNFLNLDQFNESFVIRRKKKTGLAKAGTGHGAQYTYRGGLNVFNCLISLLENRGEENIKTSLNFPP